jgi:hypothetical protein
MGNLPDVRFAPTADVRSKAAFDLNRTFVPAGERSATSSITRWRGQITCALRAGQQISTNEVLKVTSRPEFEPDAAGGGLTKSPMLEKLPDANNQSLEARAALSASTDYWPRPHLRLNWSRLEH